MDSRHLAVIVAILDSFSKVFAVSSSTRGRSFIAIVSVLKGRSQNRVSLLLLLLDLLLKDYDGIGDFIRSRSYVLVGPYASITLPFLLICDD